MDVFLLLILIDFFLPFCSLMQLSESSQPIWVAFPPTPDSSTNKEAEESSVTPINSGVVSHDGA